MSVPNAAGPLLNGDATAYPVAVEAVRRRFGREAFGDDAAAYQAARPPYPPALYEHLAACCGLVPGCAVFEIGAGTGLATVSLLDRRPRRLHLIEPDPRFAAGLTDRMVGAVPGTELVITAAPFEATHLAAASYDLGVAATSFHWVRQRTGLARVHRALRPGGWWAMWWMNFGTATSDPFQIAIQSLFARLRGEAVVSARQRPAFDLDHATRLGQLDRAGFQRTDVLTWRQHHRFTTARMIDLYRSFSVIKALPAARRDEFLRDLAAIADDQFGGAPERVFTTSLYVAQR